MKSSINKRIFLSILIAVFIAAIFWGQSRVPALNEKAQMGLRSNISQLAFEILLPVDNQQHVIERVYRSSINWAYTNWKGMLFGLLFAASILTILSNFSRLTFTRPWLNTLAGTLFGAPLGVCVNCATPIAYGIYSAGASLETALASLASSPTLNFIVLTMAFTFLPWEMALLNTLAVLVFLSFIPLLVKYANYSGINKDKSDIFKSKKYLPPYCEITSKNIEDETFKSAIKNTLISFTANFIYISKLAIPLMLLAGIIGSTVVEVIPFSYISNIDSGLIAIIVCALFAVVLPVPIAFDVIIVMALLQNGLDKGLASTLLLCLGIYSLYPAFIIGKYISLKLSISIMFLVVFIASCIGIISQNYFAYKQSNEQSYIAGNLTKNNEETYIESIEVCNSLPTHLQEPCFIGNIDQFNDIVSYETMCQALPETINVKSCGLILKEHQTSKLALKESSTEICLDIESKENALRCISSVVHHSAIKSYNINICEQLDHPELINKCRDKYLNSNLLFNPDGSACKDLNNTELEYCNVNARIYMYAENLDIKACNEFESQSAQEHCRYTIASAMIGKNNDDSGCDNLRTPSLLKRCKNLTTAWKATNDKSFSLCEIIEFADLKDLCYFKVANNKIKTILSKSILGINPYQYTNEKSGVNTTIESQMSIPTIIQWNTVQSTTSDIDIYYTPYQHQQPPTEYTKQFTSIPYEKIGITKYWEFRMTDFFEPFIYGKGIASGDFNNDLWPDIAIATESGVLVYKNTGGQFELTPINSGDLINQNIFLVAFVDTNNDGFQDIFATAYGGNNYILLNNNGSFKNARLKTIKGNQKLTFSAGFGDLNKNGQLDIVLGNWSSGLEKLFSTEYSENEILFREGDIYRTETLDGVKGESISVLVADINTDHNPDILIANDQLIPDSYYLGTGTGQFTPILAEQEIIPKTSMFTMSIDTADFNNDLMPDLFSTDMTFDRSSENDYCSPIKDHDLLKHCKTMLTAYYNFQNESAVTCEQWENLRDRHECFIAFSTKAANELKDSEICNNITNKKSAIFKLCQHLSSPAQTKDTISLDSYVNQEQKNVLLLNSKENKFNEVANELGVDSSYWSWNAKAADLDNDGWQDIYVGNGFHFGDNFYEIQENILFRNINGTHFEQVESEWGLNDYINTPSYTYLDIDLDGDTDIIATGVLSPPRIYINNENKNNAISFLLIDDRGNSSAIGAKITIEYGGKNKLRQKKENKLSSGFLSFDNPLLHFGLKHFNSVDNVIIQWPDGKTTEHKGSITSSGIYKIHRKL